MPFKLVNKIPQIDETFLLIKGDTTLMSGLINIHWEQWRVISMLDQKTYLIKNLGNDKWDTDSTSVKRDVITNDC